MCPAYLARNFREAKQTHVRALENMPSYTSILQLNLMFNNSVYNNYSGKETNTFLAKPSPVTLVFS